VAVGGRSRRREHEDDRLGLLATHIIDHGYRAWSSATRRRSTVSGKGSEATAMAAARLDDERVPGRGAPALGQVERLVGQGGQRHLVVLGERMAGREDDDEALEAQRLGAHAVGEVEGAADHHVELAGGQGGEGAGAAGVDALDDDLRVLSAQLADDAPAGVVGLVGHADPHRCVGGRGALGGADGPAQAGQRGRGAAAKRLAGLGQLDAAGRAAQQLDAEGLLELADGRAERRLAEVQPRGGGAEAQLLGDGEEGAQVAHLDSASGDGIGRLAHLVSLPPDGAPTDRCRRSIVRRSVLPDARRRA